MYKGDPQAIKQYGLVAEEVDKVYPELVVHDEAGQLQSVRYSKLTSMLLNVVQKETRRSDQQARQIEQQAQQIERQALLVEQLRVQVSKNELQAQEPARIAGRMSQLEHELTANGGKRSLAAAFRH